jgi:hypothetical protein
MQLSFGLEDVIAFYTGFSKSQDEGETRADYHLRATR